MASPNFPDRYAPIALFTQLLSVENTKPRLNAVSMTLLVKGEILMLMIVLVLVVENMKLGTSCAFGYAAGYAYYAVENMLTELVHNQRNAIIA